MAQNELAILKEAKTGVDIFIVSSNCTHYNIWMSIHIFG